MTGLIYQSIDKVAIIIGDSPLMSMGAHTDL